MYIIKTVRDGNEGSSNDVDRVLNLVLRHEPYQVVALEYKEQQYFLPCLTLWTSMYIIL